MSVRRTAKRQYQAKVDKAASSPVKTLTPPSEGWIATVRQALGLSGAQLGRITGKTRATISAAEKSEREGGISLQNLSALADAMNCKLVYAIVPKDGSIEELLKAQANRKAEALVSRASAHMALEKQALQSVERARQVELLAEELLRERPSAIWER